jgi:four helix bundle protein
MLNSHRELHVWQRAIQLAVAVYRLTAGFPRDETYGLSRSLKGMEG